MIPKGDPILCEHANECPQSCPCDADCYCKEHTCKARAEDNPSAMGQKLPVKNNNPYIVDLVIADVQRIYENDSRYTRYMAALNKDLRDRADVGAKKYGVYLQAFNGRDVLMDAYQELLDGMKYLRQAIVEYPDNIEFAVHYANLMATALDLKKRMK